MADPRAFISCEFDHDEAARNLFVRQSKHSKTPFNIEDWSSKQTWPQSQWEKLIKDKINRCHMVIVLVGKHMASASGVAKEIKWAKEQDVPVFGVYVNDATSSSTLPEGLARSRVIPWEWDKIASMIDQVMTEGKNKSVKSFF